jgi:integrase/recombinase XerD
MIASTVKLRRAFHYEKAVIQILFERQKDLQDYLRSKTGMRWSKTMNCWYLPFTSTVKQELQTLLRGRAELEEMDTEGGKVAVQDLKLPDADSKLGLPPLGMPEIKKMEEFTQWLRSKRYSENTICTYVDALQTFLRFFADKPLSSITNNDLIVFNNKYILAKKLSASFQNQVVNAVKLFFSTIESKQLNPELIHRPKRAKVLPNVLSKEEVKSLLEALPNLKHRTMLSLIYSCGLRRGELLSLKLTNIDSKRNLLLVKQAKGRKDRVVPLSDKTLDLLRAYFVAYKPKDWLFEGQNKSEQYDERSLASVLKLALERSKINKPVSLHWLRHSYATHLLENGTDLRYIQEILGHASSRTTEIYTHVSNKSLQKIVSPFDSL